MTQPSNIKYKKRAWQKYIGKLYYTKTISRYATEMVLYKGKGYLRLICLNKELSNDILTLKPKTKLTIWFSIKCIVNNAYWETNLYLMHYEDVLKSKIEYEQKNLNDNQYLKTSFKHK